MHEKLLAVLALLAVTAFHAAAQISVAPEPVRPNTDTWEFIKYGEISPSLYTGSISLSIPLYTYKDNDFEIPVSFDYSSGGTMPNDRAGLLGTGWTLNAGGVITREVRGVPDDYKTNAMPLQFGYANIPGYYFTASSGLEFHTSELYAIGGPWQDSMICLYLKTDTEGNKSYYDAEPDVFHFNFMGHSGSFMLDGDGNPVVFGTDENPNGFTVELGFEEGFGDSPIAITTTDGYRYEFDGFINSANTEKFYPKGSSKIQSWRLSRIVAPNGRTAEFDYFNTQAIQARRPASVCYDVFSFSGYTWDFTELDVGRDQHTLATPEYSVARLTSIVVDGRTEISFDYESAVEILYSTDFEKEDETMQRNGAGRLLKVSVQHEGDTIRTCRLSYDNDNPARRSFLKSVDISGEGTYSMTYYKTDGLPIYGTFKVDHWGYYNGNPDTGKNFLKVTRLTNDNLDEEYLPDNPRAADAEYARRGMLDRIVWPTGGYTEFLYEPHSYSKVIKRTSASHYRPVLASGTGIAGGLRIKEINSHESDGTLLSSRGFIYGSPQESSGILTFMPRYSVKFHASVTGHEYETYGTIWSNNLTRYGQTHIEYGEVTEVDADGGMKTFRFSTSEMYPDVIENKGYIVDKLLGAQGGMNEWEIPADSLANLFTNTSMQRLRGKLLSTGYIRADGDTLKTVSADFGKVRTIPEFIYVPKYLFYALASTGEYSGHVLRNSDTETARYGDLEVTKETKYTYNSRLQLSSKSEAGPDGETRITRYKYVADNPTGINAEMAAKGFFDFPLEIAEYVRQGDSGETLLRRTVYTYLKPDADAHPDLYRIATATEYDPVSGKSSVTSYKYDSLGNLVEATDPDGVSTVYIWGHGGLHLVAAVGNATIEQVEDASLLLPMFPGGPSRIVLPLSGIRE
ncbi:MAG TPA: hypothetical protein IAC35_07275, partial [Candidatus Cryptobacteroides merdipullorum]|nr:hypothetical protein [Candidatus Cryptobacteroides merdipullorum]